MTGAAADQRGPWADEVTDLVTGAAGGMLFGVPLLLTMEVWWTGSHTSAEQALGMLAVTGLAVLLLNRTAGFRATSDVRWRDAAADTVEAVALGLVLVTAVLALLREITPGTPPGVVIGKVVYEAFPFCLGIAVANQFLRGGRESTGEDEDGSDDGGRRGPWRATLADVGATAVGATFVALNIAPTDEVPMVTAALPPLHLAGVVLASLAISYGIVFAAAFARHDDRHAQPGPFQRPITETVVCYLVALLAALLMLGLFQRIDGPWTATLDQVVVLGLPAAVGGAAGRLAI